MPTLPVSFSALPTEVIGNIFAFVRPDAETCNVCLVSRQWRNIMVGIMWEHITTKMEPTTAREMDALVGPKSGIPGRVRSLWINQMEKSDAAEKRLKQLLEVIPKNRLRAFDCGTNLDPSTLQLLLQHHQTLERLDITDAAGLAGKEGIEPALLSITDFCLSSPPQNLSNKEANEQFESCRTLIKIMPKLTKFRVRYHEDAQGPVDIYPIFSHDENESFISRLTDLSLEGIEIAPVGPTLIKQICVSNLKALNLFNCDKIIYFLNGLCELYSVIPGPLTDVCIDFGWTLTNPVKTVRAIERFLRACPLLSWLRLDILKYEKLLDFDCIARHADKLETLCINISSWPSLQRHYEMHELRQIIEPCRKLTTLTINVPSFDIGPVMDLGEDFRLGQDRFDTAYVETELEAVLSILSHHTSLRYLRFLDLPIIQYSELLPEQPPGSITETDAKFCKIVMQNYVNQVLAFMWSRGSRVKLLVLQPAVMPVKRPAKDVNGHQWPVYTYTKGVLRDALGSESVVAVPLDKIREEMCEQDSMLWT